MAQPLKLGTGPLSEPGEFGGQPSGYLLSLSDQISLRGSPKSDPFADYGLEGFFWPVRVNHERGRHSVDYDSEPLQHVLSALQITGYST